MTDLEKNKFQEVELYVAEVSKQFATGKATEHSYRPALATLLSELLPKFVVTNEPRRIDCGAPDYIISKGGSSNIPMAFVEAKDVNDRDLDGNREHKEQFNRYKNSLDHILFTDYLDFHLYEFGEFVDSVRIAEVRGDKVVIIQPNVTKFLEMVDSFSGALPQKISSAKKLAQMMAAKAKLLAETIHKTLENDSEKTGELAGQWNAFKNILIHDLTEKAFADIYAQTIAYGMFAARLHDKTPDTFSRAEAATLIPETNPFLRKIFQSIAGFDMDESIVWIVDDLVETFRVTDISKVMKNFGQASGQGDPLIHFYEDFLYHYDPKQKKSCGVYYTPEPVVDFMVNAVDEILKDMFKLPMGLADTSKVKLKRSNDLYTDNRTTDHKRHEEKEYHRVQILDPATGTATFPAKIVRKIYSSMQGNLGAWQNYVDEHLLPRLNGFEFMMAPYAIAHLKLDMVLSETGYVPQKNKRLRIYLTNSLEECDPNTGTLFAQWLAQEASEANLVKRDTPVMVMIGNPPYSVSSSNNGPWINGLMNDYKKDLKERNIQPLSDDYIKFIRLAHYYVAKNGEGVVAYISNNSFIDGMIHRQMRKSLLETFDEIYILDLHGNSRKKETALDGSKDENVFDIMQGVSINIFVKKGNVFASGASCHSRRLSSLDGDDRESPLARVFHYELYGKRAEKYHYLKTHSIKDVPWQELNLQAPQYFFVPKDFSVQGEYEKGFKIDELMKIYVSGIQSGRDDLFVDVCKNDLKNRISILYSSKRDLKFNEQYKVKDSSGYNLLNRIAATNFNDQKIRITNYRPFDNRYLYYDENLIKRAFYKVQRNLLEKNVCILCCKQLSMSFYGHVFISENISDLNSISLQTKEQSYVFPLYLYPTENEANLGEQRKPNLDETIWRKIDACLDSSTAPSGSAQNDNLHITTPEQIFDYIYGVLHTPSYRERYKEFLKIEFPRIPYPENADEFNRIAAIGEKLRKLHLMQEILQPLTVSFNTPGDNIVTELRYEMDPIEASPLQGDKCVACHSGATNGSDRIHDNACKAGKVFINKSQCFENVPELAWNFYIGGYQPAQKWLKDRKNRTLTYDDIEHYRKIIAILIETHNLMQKLD
jgi:Predicted helicase